MWQFLQNTNEENNFSENLGHILWTYLITFFPSFLLSFTALHFLGALTSFKISFHIPHRSIAISVFLFLLFCGPTLLEGLWIHFSNPFPNPLRTNVSFNFVISMVLMSTSKSCMSLFLDLPFFLTSVISEILETF